MTWKQLTRLSTDELVDLIEGHQADESTELDAYDIVSIRVTHEALETALVTGEAQ